MIISSSTNVNWSMLLRSSLCRNRLYTTPKDIQSLHKPLSTDSCKLCGVDFKEQSCLSQQKKKKKV